MKKIILVRHASAEPRGTDVKDFSRSLRKRGHKEARTMIRWYLEHTGEKPDSMLSSPANRAIETAELFAKGIGYKSKKIAKDKALYGTASSEDFLEIVKALDDREGSVMVFGHDPAFSEFAKYMVDEFDSFLPKCSVFGFSVNRKTWKALKPGDGRLEFFESPGGVQDRRDLSKQVRRDLSGRIEDRIWNVLAEFGIDKKDENKCGKYVRRASAGIARTLEHRLDVAGQSPASKGSSAGESGEETTS